MTTTNRTAPTSATSVQTDRTVSPNIEDLILRVTDRVEVADASAEGEVRWREATVAERELFGERIWEG